MKRINFKNTSGKIISDYTEMASEAFKPISKEIDAQVRRLATLIAEELPLSHRELIRIIKDKFPKALDAAIVTHNGQVLQRRERKIPKQAVTYCIGCGEVMTKRIKCYVCKKPFCEKCSVIVKDMESTKKHIRVRVCSDCERRGFYVRPLSVRKVCFEDEIKRRRLEDERKYRDTLPPYIASWTNVEGRTSCNG